ncbi:hypothetical protein TWF281_000276 [Arthrobotrys megalospora]
MMKPPTFLTTQVLPVKIPTAYFLVCHEFTLLVTAVSQDIDRRAPQPQFQFSKCFTEDGMVRPFSTVETFLKFWDPKSPGRIIFGGFPDASVMIGHRTSLFPDIVARTVKWIYLTKSSSIARYPGWGDWHQRGDYGMQQFLRISFPCLETLSLGVCRKMGVQEGHHPIAEALFWLCRPYEPRLEGGGRATNRKLELVFAKKGKEADCPLDLESYLRSPDGYKWVQKRLDETVVSKRVRYVNEWDYFKRIEVKKEEEGDIWQVELWREEAVSKERVEVVDWTDLFETFPLSITSVFK